MAQVVFTLPDKEQQELKNKASSLGLTLSGYVRQVLKDSINKKSKEDQVIIIKAIRKLIPVLAEALGRTQNADSKAIEKLTQILLKEYDRG